MRIKLDENMPDRLVAALRELGHEVDTVLSEQIAGAEDDVVWRKAQADSRFLITQDLDFSDVRQFAPGTHYGLLLVRLPQPGRIALLERVSALFREEDVESWAGCLVTATPRKVRVRRPESN